ncbi:MAG TPA: hypothetical protein VJ738_00130 [Steroidobacteraceae bacterium]|nr:hypothetical protein [Steroidobacteraceae bacterium]
MRFLVLVIAGYLLIAWLPRCAQQLPQLVSNTAGQAASGAASAAGNGLSNVGHNLLQRLKNLFTGARDQWDNADPAGKFDFICEHTPVEGVDKLCPYLTAALQGASDAQTARIACYWHAAATAPPNPPQTVRIIDGACGPLAGNPSALELCLSQHVESGDVANCLSTAPQQLWPELHTMTKPIACIPGLPESWCSTQPSAQSSSASNANPSTPMRMDVNFTNCLQTYYLTPAVRATYQASCGTTVNPGNEACVMGQLQSFNYPGQVSLGQQYINACAQTQP